MQRGGGDDGLVVQLQEEAGQDPSFEAWLAAASGLLSLSGPPRASDRVLDALESVYLLLMQEIGEDHNSKASTTTPTATTTTTTTAATGTGVSASDLASREVLLTLCETLWRYLPPQMGAEKERFRRLAEELRPGGRLALLLPSVSSPPLSSAPPPALRTAAGGDGSSGTKGGSTTSNSGATSSSSSRALLHSIIGRRRIDVSTHTGMLYRHHIISYLISIYIYIYWCRVCGGVCAVLQAYRLAVPMPMQVW
jgi:hypothetical protein